MHRRPSERTFLFGIHPVLEALEERKPLQRVLFLKGKQTDELSAILSECRALDVPAQAVPKERLDRITRKNHQGVVAFTSPIEFQPLDEVILGAFERGETPSGRRPRWRHRRSKFRSHCSHCGMFRCHGSSSSRPQDPPPSTRRPSNHQQGRCFASPCAVRKTWLLPSHQPHSSDCKRWRFQKRGHRQTSMP